VIPLAPATRSSVMALGCSAKTLGSDVRFRENSGHVADLCNVCF